MIVTKEFLNERAKRSVEAGYPKQKWIEFCEMLLNIDCGFELHLKEAKTTVSNNPQQGVNRLNTKVRGLTSQDGGRKIHLDFRHTRQVL